MGLKRLLLLILTSLSVISINGQKLIGDYYPLFCDEVIINNTRDSLSNVGIEELIVFQTSVGENQNMAFVITYLLWNDNTNGYLKEINDSIIYKTVKCDKFRVFGFPNIPETRIDNRYDRPYNFVCPIVNNENRFIIYSNKEMLFSFPSGDISFEYNEDPVKHKQRKRFADIIESEILNCKSLKIKEKSYRRFIFDNYNESEDSLIQKSREKYKK